MTRESFKLRRLDFIIMGALTLIFALITIPCVGSLQVPERGIETLCQTQRVAIAVPNGAKIGDIWMYKGIDTTQHDSQDKERHRIYIYGSEMLLEDWQEVFNHDHYGMIELTNQADTGRFGFYKWNKVKDCTLEYDKFKVLGLSIFGEGVRINEIVMTDEVTKEPIPLTILGSNFDVTGLFDEQSFFPKTPSFKTDFYWDEVFFARTAYEMVMGVMPSEITHPPLGKLMIAIGIDWFGMNPFGWRFIPLLFSIFLVPSVYLLGKALLHKRVLVGLLASFFCIDGLHLVQGNISTVDTFVVFFIVWMYYFMAKFFCSDMLEDKWTRTLLPFGLAGFFFGCAAATKWTGIYAGIGLLCILIWYLLRAYHRAGKERRSIFLHKLIGIGATGFGAFIVLAGTIYILSYLPFMVEGESRNLFEVMWANQQYILHFHAVKIPSQAPHSLASKWYEWPLNLSSVLFYSGDYFDADTYAKIHTMGLTSLYWLCSFSLFFGAFQFVWKSVQHMLIKRGNFTNEKKGNKGDKVKKHLEQDVNVCQEHGVLNEKRMVGIQESVVKKSYEIDYVSLIFIGIGFAANYLPWIFITRSTFTYHFYNSVPFFLMFGVIFIHYLWNCQGKILFSIKFTKKYQFEVTIARLFVIILLVVMLLNFILFYPLYAGLPIPKAEADWRFRYIKGILGHYPGL